jgi:hypothetical protein
MNTIDFLSSDIEFPCDSNEPKLSASPCTKLPESVDWSFHDYYSTVLEKNFSPIHSITDIRHLEAVGEQVAPPIYLPDYKNPSLFSDHDKQDDQAVVLVLTNTLKPSVIIPPSAHQQSKQNNLRAALRGALDLVENDMQKNMHNSLQTPPPKLRSIMDYPYLSWKDDILTETLHMGALDQDLWDDDDEDDILRSDASPAYHAIDENPIIDSSLPSRISSIMPLSSTPSLRSRQQSYAFTPHAVQTITESSSSPSSSSSSVHDTPSRSVSPVTNESSASTTTTTKASKIKSWNVWNKVKQATQPITKQFKSATSSKKAFKRLFL